MERGGGGLVVPRRLVIADRKKLFVEVASRVVDEKHFVFAAETMVLVLFFCFWYICLLISSLVERQRRSALLRSRLAFRMAEQYQGAEGRSVTSRGEGGACSYNKI